MESSGFGTMIVGHRSKNHPQQTAKRGALADVDDRRTPRHLFDLWQVEFGFTLDAAATAENTKLPKFCRDGLTESWQGERVWCNPPYSHIEPWVEKAWREILQGGCECVVMLLPANRTEQGWWQRHVEDTRDRLHANGHLTVRFLAGRIRFDRPGWTKPAKGDRPPFGLCLLIWSALPFIAAGPPGSGQCW
jgi:phage N-6-adenine-methyltransferase